MYTKTYSFIGPGLLHAALYLFNVKVINKNVYVIVDFVNFFQPRIDS